MFAIWNEVDGVMFWQLVVTQLNGLLAWDIFGGVIALLGALVLGSMIVTKLLQLGRR